MGSPDGRNTRVALAQGLVLLATTGCATLTAQQRAAVSKVSVITSEPALNCQNLGVVSGSRESEGPDGVRAKAVLLGANTVRVDAQGATTAFYCPDSAEAPDTEPTP